MNNNPTTTINNQSTGDTEPSVYELQQLIHVLQEHNLQQSAELERWKKLATMYHDTVWKLILKYEPENYTKAN